MMQVKAVRMLTTSALVGAVLVWGGRLLTGDDMTPAGDLQVNPVVHFAAAYLICLIAFAACPRTRRSDIAKLGFMTGVLLCLIRALAWREDMAAAVAGEALGVAAAVLPSRLERLRAALRANPESVVSLRRPDDRRAPRSRARGPVFAPQDVTSA